MSVDLSSGQDERYAIAAAEFGGAMERLARAYEADADPRRDLIQDIHVALWHSLAGFDGRCSLRTWVYRVAHNTAASHVQRRRRWRGEQGATLEALEAIPDPDNPEAAAGGAALPRRPRRRGHRRVVRQSPSEPPVAAADRRTGRLESRVMRRLSSLWLAPH